MDSVLQNDVISKLPVAELSSTLDGFLEPVLMHVPEKRLQAVGNLAAQRFSGGQSPVVTQMARCAAREEEAIWPTAKRLYRFV